MKKWKLYAGLVLIFILGVVAGSLGDRFVHKQRFDRFRKDPGARKTLFLERLTKKLDLTEEQKKVFEQIVTRIDERMQGHRKQKRSEMKAIMDEGFSQMSEQLTPEQKKKLDKMRKKARRFLGRPPGPSHPKPPRD
jgi:Spy/CpxP family protein refolding chaperone